MPGFSFEIYRESALAVQKIKDERISIRNYIDKIKEKTDLPIGTIYSIIQKSLSNLKQVKKIIEKCRLGNDFSKDKRFLLEVIVADVVFGKASKRALRNCLHQSGDDRDLLQMIIENITSIQSYKDSKNTLSNKSNDSKDSLPVCYVRINLIKTNQDEVLKSFIENGHKLIQTPDDLKEFIETASKLQKYEMMIDYHFKDLILIPICDKRFILNYHLYKNGKIIIQDKGSLLVLELMKLTEGMTVFDICAAPGTKTAAMASKCKNNLKIYSLDINKKRCIEMEKLLNNLGVNCVKILNEDFLDETTLPVTDIDVLTLDPSCSGSGLYNRYDYEKGFDRGRSLKLASFQTKLLCKAMSLKPKKIIYSTCSLDTTENEFVVSSAFKESPDASYYEVEDNVFTSWPFRGEGDSEHASKYVRANKKILSKGFFAASIVRKD